jgi:type II secretory pathway component PulK
MALLIDTLDARESVLALDPRLFEAIQVGAGRFWIIRPDYADPALPAFGLNDESAKIDINFASLARLSRLAGLNEDLAAAIVDWRDEDDDLTPGGAESSVYLTKSEPYRAKNDRFETVEELLLVHGFSRSLLYGIDPQPPLGQASAARNGGIIAGDPYTLRGIWDYLTIHSASLFTNPSGQRRVNINNPGQRQNLRRVLQEQLGNERGEQVFARLGNQPFVDVFDLAVRTQLEVAEFERLEPYLSSSNARRVRGRINVNAAPRQVLMTLLGLESADVDELMAARSGRASLSASHTPSVAWVYETLGSRAVGLGNQIIAQGRQFSADIVAVSGNGRGFCRVRIVINANSSTPRIVYRRDLTDRGWPLDPGILLAQREDWARRSR